MTDKQAIDLKLTIAGKLTRALKRRLGANLKAIGACGSVARGTADKYSDIDLLIIVGKPTVHFRRFDIIENTYCSLNILTEEEARSQLRTPHHELPETLGGFTKILPLYDPEGILSELERTANAISPKLFHESARLALIHSFEDFCRVKNAYLKSDIIVMKDNILEVTHSAANIVAALNQAHFVSDREIFKAHRRFRKLPKDYSAIEELRYELMEKEELVKSFLQFYLNLIRFCKREGVGFPVAEDVLSAL